MEECSICFNVINSYGYSPGCTHYFHTNCLKQWMRYKRSCPMCRMEIPVEKSLSIQRKIIIYSTSYRTVDDIACDWNYKNDKKVNKRQRTRILDRQVI